MIIQLTKPEFNNNNDNVFRALPTGDYQASVIDTKLSLTKSNRPMLTIKYKLFGEKRFKGAMLDGRVEHQKILLDTEFTGKILGDVLYSLGFNTTNAIDVKKMVGYSALIGKKCLVHLEESSYIKGGKEFPCNEIKYIKKHSNIQHVEQTHQDKDNKLQSFNDVEYMTTNKPIETNYPK